MRFLNSTRIQVLRPEPNLVELYFLLGLALFAIWLRHRDISAFRSGEENKLDRKREEARVVTIPLPVRDFTSPDEPETVHIESPTRPWELRAKVLTGDSKEVVKHEEELQALLDREREIRGRYKTTLEDAGLDQLPANYRNQPLNSIINYLTDSRHRRPPLPELRVEAEEILELARNICIDVGDTYGLAKVHCASVKQLLLWRKERISREIHSHPEPVISDRDYLFKNAKLLLLQITHLSEDHPFYRDFKFVANIIAAGRRREEPFVDFWDWVRYEADGVWGVDQRGDWRYELDFCNAAISMYERIENPDYEDKCGMYECLRRKTTIHLTPESATSEGAKYKEIANREQILHMLSRELIEIAKEIDRPGPYQGHVRGAYGSLTDPRNTGPSIEEKIGATKEILESWKEELTDEGPEDSDAHISGWGSYYLYETSMELEGFYETIGDEAQAKKYNEEADQHLSNISLAEVKERLLLEKAKAEAWGYRPWLIGHLISQEMADELQVVMDRLRREEE